MTHKDSYECVTVNVYITVESSLFLGDQYSMLLRVTMPTNLHPWNEYTSICLIFIRIIQNFLPTKFRPHKPEKMWLPMNSDRHKLK